MKNENPTSPVSTPTGNRPRTRRMVGASTLSASVIIGLVSLSAMPSAFAAEAKVNLGTSDSYSVLAGQTVTNTGSTVLSSDLGVSPGTAITGFPPGIVLGTVHAADAEAAQAQSDLTIAYDDAAGRASTALVEGDLVGKTLVGGVYKASDPLLVSGTLTLDAQGDPNTVFIFQSASSLTTASDSAISLINGAQACNVYWQVGSSATLGTSSDFKGSILALTSISVNTDTTVEGRAMARNGQVSLDNNVFTAPGCATSIPVEEETPVEEVPVEETPTDGTPVEEAPVEGDTPVEETPNEETIIEEETPNEETIIEEETPNEETIIEEEIPTNEEIIIEEEIPTNDETIIEEEEIPTNEETIIEEESPVVDSSTGEDIAQTGSNSNFLALGISILMLVIGSTLIWMRRTVPFAGKHSA